MFMKPFHFMRMYIKVQHVALNGATTESQPERISRLFSYMTTGCRRGIRSGTRAKSL